MSGSTSAVMTVKIESDNSAGGGGSPGGSGIPRTDPSLPLDQRTTTGLMEQRRKAFEAMRREEMAAETKRLRDIQEGHRLLEGLRKKRQEAEEKLETERLESVGRRAADVIRQRNAANNDPNQAGLAGLINRFVPGAGGMIGKLGIGGKVDQNSFVGKDIKPAPGTMLARAVPAAAEGGMAGLGGAATAAAGPLAAAFLIAEVSARALAGAANYARMNVEQVGKGFRRLADDDIAGKFEDSVDNFATNMEKVPISGQVVGAVARAAAAPILEFKKTVDTYLGRARELAGFSGAASTAEAYADVRKVMADLKEGQQLGEGYARMIEAQSKAETTVRGDPAPTERESRQRLGEPAGSGRERGQGVPGCGGGGCDHWYL
jgi:hypothetical protein